MVRGLSPRALREGRRQLRRQHARERHERQALVRARREDGDEDAGERVGGFPALGRPEPDEPGRDRRQHQADADRDGQGAEGQEIGVDRQGRDHDDEDPQRDPVSFELAGGSQEQEPESHGRDEHERQRQGGFEPGQRQQVVGDDLRQRGHVAPLADERTGVLAVGGELVILGQGLAGEQQAVGQQDREDRSRDRHGIGTQEARGLSEEALRVVGHGAASYAVGAAFTGRSRPTSIGRCLTDRRPRSRSSIPSTTAAWPTTTPASRVGWRALGLRSRWSGATVRWCSRPRATACASRPCSPAPDRTIRAGDVASATPSRSRGSCVRSVANAPTGCCGTTSKCPGSTSWRSVASARAGPGLPSSRTRPSRGRMTRPGARSTDGSSRKQPMR